MLASLILRPDDKSEKDLITPGHDCSICAESRAA